MSGIKKIIDQEKLAIGLVGKDKCYREENERYKTMEKEGKALPEGVYPYDFQVEGYYRIDEVPYTDDDMLMLLALKQTNYLKRIDKNILIMTGIIVMAVTLLAVPALVIMFVST